MAFSPVFLYLPLRVLKSDNKNNNGMKCWSVTHEMTAGLIFSLIAIGGGGKKKGK